MELVTKYDMGDIFYFVSGEKRVTPDEEKSYRAISLNLIVIVNISFTDEHKIIYKFGGSDYRTRMKFFDMEESLVEHEVQNKIYFRTYEEYVQQLVNLAQEYGRDVYELKNRYLKDKLEKKFNKEDMYD